MWKNFNRFYTEILYSEISLLTHISCVNQIGVLQKIVFSLNAKQSSGFKDAFLHFSCLHLLLNSKGKLIWPKRHVFNLRQGKSLVFGSSFIIRKPYTFSFLSFSLFNFLGESNPQSLIRFFSELPFFCFSLSNIRALSRIEFSRTFFKKIANLQVLFSFNSHLKATFFSLRFFKFPITLR